MCNKVLKNFVTTNDVMCPNCGISLLNAGLDIKIISIVATYYKTNFEDGSVNENKYFYTDETLGDEGEEYFCSSCGGALEDLFDYMMSMKNTSEMGLSEEVDSFLCSVYKLVEEGI